MNAQHDNDALRQADAQMESVREMVAALEVDYDRLEELRAERQAFQDEIDEAATCVRHHNDGELDADGPHTEHAEYRRCRDDLQEWLDENREEMAELEDAAVDCDDREDAENRIKEDALSVEIRSDWRPVGDDSDDSEFRIVLCTGGPHVQIMGELAQGVPVRAWLEYQDWGTPMTERANDEGDHDALLAYASQFFFGE